MATGKTVQFHWSTKGGSGTSTNAAATAARSAACGRRTVLIDLCGDLEALIGMVTTPDARPPGVWLSHTDLRMLEELVAPDLSLVTLDHFDGSDATHRDWLVNAVKSLDAEGAAVIVDGGLDDHDVRLEVLDEVDSAEQVVTVRACYLALMRAQKRAEINRSARVLCVEEQGRALLLRNVAAALSAEPGTVQPVPWDPRVARGVDSGTLMSQLPPTLLHLDLGGLDPTQQGAASSTSGPSDSSAKPIRAKASAAAPRLTPSAATKQQSSIIRPEIVQRLRSHPRASYGDIADRLGVSASYVGRVARAEGLQRR